MIPGFLTTVHVKIEIQHLSSVLKPIDNRSKILTVSNFHPTPLGTFRLRTTGVSTSFAGHAFEQENDEKVFGF